MLVAITAFLVRLRRFTGKPQVGHRVALEETGEPHSKQVMRAMPAK